MLSTKQLYAATRWKTLAKLTQAVVEDMAAAPGSVEEMVATDSEEEMVGVASQAMEEMLGVVTQTMEEKLAIPI